VDDDPRITDLLRCILAYEEYSVAVAASSDVALMRTLEHAPDLAFLQRHAEELPVEERRTMLSDAHAEILRLAQPVEELLLFARADASVDTLPTLAEKEAAHSKQPIELDHTVLQLVRQLRGRLPKFSVVIQHEHSATSWRARMLVYRSEEGNTTLCTPSLSLHFA
jgi:signal transduction histidine kinase